MRLALPSLAVVLALALAPSALGAADHPVTIGVDGYDDGTGRAPVTVVAHPGDSVTFTRSVGVLKDVQFDDRSSALCGAALSCARSFPSAGRFGFYEPGCGSSAACPANWRGVVVVDGPPAVTSLAVPANGVRGQLVALSAAAGDPNGDSVNSYNWDFGDGGGASVPGPDVQHAYAAAGRFIVTLTATDSRGNVSAPVQAAIDVRVPDTDADGIDDDLDRCVTVAGPAPDGCPLDVRGLVPDPIQASAAAAARLGVAGALRRGVTSVLSCTGACTAVLALTYKGKLVGTARAALSATASKLVRIALTPGGKRAVARAKRPRIVLTTTVTDALARVQTLRSSVVLERVKHGRVPATGISDQKPETFSDPYFQVLGLRYARLVTPWNSVFAEPARLDAWLQAARAQGIRPLVSFERARGQECPRRPCRAPTIGQYRRAWAAFHGRYRWVRDVSPWNEVNSATQPTGKRPALAAAYYNVVRASCRGCQVVAADLLDSSNIRRYVTAFLKRAKGTPRLWGLHNYSDANRFRARGTEAMLASVKGKVWLTETGGVVRFTTQDGRVALRPSESRARKAIGYMFRLAERNARRIKRIYVYQWKVNNPFDRFDAGIVRPDGTPRPSYDVLSVNASIARKR